MKVLFKNLTKVSLAITLASSFVSCSDDDENILTDGTDVAPAASVFTNGIPTSVNGATIALNDKKQVVEIKSTNETVTFEYGSFSRSTDYSVVMKVREGSESNYGSDFYLQLNKQGFITYAYQEEYDEGDTEFEGEWWFEYNNAGQMTKFKHNDDGYAETYTLAYSNGDVTKVNYIDEDGETSEATIGYVNDKHTSLIENKGCIMLFEDALGVDLDEMEIAYYAGLLGKATKNLPMRYTETYESHGSEYTETYDFNWTFNNQGLPTSFQIGDYEWNSIKFTW